MSLPEKRNFERQLKNSLDVNNFVRRYLPDGKKKGNEWVALNPTRSDSSLGSFSVNLNTGEWADFATNDKGGRCY